MTVPDTSTSVARGEERSMNPRAHEFSLWARNNMALVLLIVLVLAGGVLSDVFLTSRNLLNIMYAISILGIIALGQTIC